MRLRSVGTATITFAALLLVPPTAAHAAGCPSPGSLPSAPATPESQYFGKDARLGPDPLPSAAPIAGFIKGYNRFGSMAEDQWRAKYLVGTDYYNYPADDGFVVKDKKPQRQRITLVPGTQIDRFGYSSGAYLGKRGDSFAQRSLIPKGLITPDGSAPDYQGNFRIGNAIVPPSNYHQYCVQHPFDVDSGPIADYYGQSGGGTQYLLMPGYVPGQPANGKENKPMIEWLLHNGPANVNAKGLDANYLVEIAP